MFWKIQDRETGTLIDTFKTEADAEKKLQEYEEQDEKDGTYEPDFYEIVEVNKYIVTLVGVELPATIARKCENLNEWQDEYLKRTAQSGFEQAWEFDNLDEAKAFMADYKLDYVNEFTVSGIVFQCKKWLELELENYDETREFIANKEA
jgi:hypothetical protein